MRLIPIEEANADIPQLRITWHNSPHEPKIGWHHAALHLPCAYHRGESDTAEIRLTWRAAIFINGKIVDFKNTRRSYFLPCHIADKVLIIPLNSVELLDGLTSNTWTRTKKTSPKPKEYPKKIEVIYEGELWSYSFEVERNQTPTLLFLPHFNDIKDKQESIISLNNSPEEEYFDFLKAGFPEEREGDLFVDESMVKDIFSEESCKTHNLDFPRCRPMNSDPTDDFVAIDFETMTHLRTSACALGMVKVIDGCIVQRFYTLINPIRDEYTDKEPCLCVHGIPLAEAEKAPTFSQLFPMLKDFIENLPLVCHNAGFDLDVFNQTMKWFGLDGIDTKNYHCTYHETGKSLKDCCEQYGIALPHHHDALCDAEACARIYLSLIGKPLLEVNSEFKQSGNNKTSKAIQSAHRLKLDDDQIENKQTIFYNSTVVISGTFEDFPSRDDLAAKLQALGAKVNSTISKKTDILIAGAGVGPAKLAKVRELHDQGHRIRILQAHELADALTQSCES